MSPDGVDPRPADLAGTTTHVIDMGQQPIDSRRRLPWRLFAAAAAVVVVVAGVVGYVIGDQHGAAMTMARPLVSPTRVVEPLSTVSVTGRQCAVEVGHQLQVGIEITNDTRQTVSLKAIDVDAPLPGFNVRAKQFGTCGVVGGNTGPQPLAPGNSTWISATFDNHLSCQGPSSSNISTASIIFTVHYDDGLTATGGFSNLPDIALPACAQPSG